MRMPKFILRPVAAVLSVGMVCGPMAPVAVANTGTNTNNPPVKQDQVDTTGSDPIEMSSGNRWFTARDIALPAPGITMEFIRRYNSQETEYEGVLGKGWAHSLDWRLFETVERVEDITPPGGLEEPPAMVVRMGSELSIQHSSTAPLTLVPLFFTGAVALPRFPHRTVEETQTMYVKSGAHRFHIDISGQYNIFLPEIGDRPDWIVTAIEDENGDPLPIVGLNYDADEYQVGDPVPDGGGMTFGGIARRTHAYLDLRTEEAERVRFRRQADGTYRPLGDSSLRLRQEGNLFIMRMAGGEERVFNQRGLMTEIRDLWGNKVVLSYNSTTGMLQTAQHSNGMSFTFTYSGNRLVRVDASADLYLTFTYNQNGQLATATRHANGQTSAFEYEYTDGFLTRNVNPLGHSYNYTYHDGSEGQPWQARSMVVEPGGWLEDDVAYLGDTIRRLSFPMASRGVTPVYEWGFSNKGFLLDARLGPGATVEAARARGIRYVYDDGRPVREIMFDDAAGESLTQFKAYDTDGNLSKLEVAYVDRDNPTAVRHTAFDAEYHPDYRLPTRIIDAAGNRVETVYTNAQPSVVRAFGSDTESHDTVFAYTAGGLVSSVTDAKGHSTVFTYDGRGYPSTMTPPAGPSIRTEHDAYGFPSLMEVLPSGGTNGAGRATSFDYNARGRLDSIGFPDGLSATFEYNAMDYLTRATDRAGRHTDYTYAPTRKLASMTRYLDPDDPGGNTPVTLAYDYDEQFNTLRITEPRGRYVESYALDLQDRITAVTNINGQTMTVSYGLGDFVRSAVRFDGSSVEHAYDNAGRRVATSLDDGQTSRTIAISYTSNSLVSALGDGTTSFAYGYDRLNRLTSVVRGGAGILPASAAYSYDPVGNLTNAVVSINGGAAVLQRAFAYDAADRLTSLTGSGTGVPPVAFALDYNPTNGLMRSFANVVTGIGAACGYDIMDRRTEIAWHDGATNLLYGFRMAFDNASMITNVTYGTGEYRVYGYDSLDRLVSERHFDAMDTPVYGAAYEFDLAGNRTKTVINGVTNVYTLGVGDRLASWGQNGENTVTYDDAGNVTQLVVDGLPTRDLEWDIQYRLTSVSTNGTPVESYLYDAVGRRIATAGGAGTEWHVHDGMHVIADTDGTGNLLRSYTWGPGIDNLLAMTVYGPGATNTYQAITDHLGTVHAFVDENGDTVESYEFDAWGNVLGVFDANGQSIPMSGIGNRYLFHGREYSWTTGLYNFRARWYDPLTGRWLANDPIGISGGLNQYVAFGNNPVMFVDPYGLCTEDKVTDEWWKKVVEIIGSIPRRVVSKLAQKIAELNAVKIGLAGGAGRALGFVGLGWGSVKAAEDIYKKVVPRSQLMEAIIADDTYNPGGQTNVTQVLEDRARGIW